MSFRHLLTFPFKDILNLWVCFKGPQIFLKFVTFKKYIFSLKDGIK